MKTLPAVLFLSLPIAAAAVETPLAFPDVKLTAPPLSLVGNSLQGLPSFLNDFKGEGPNALARQIVVLRMPIIPGSRECDPKMIKEPDPSIDYKLIIKTPEIEQPK
jgi:hypothetical protein